MKDVTRIEGDFNAAGARVAIVAGRFNSFVVDHLISGAIDCLQRHGTSAKDIDVFYAPGAYELPLLAQRVAGKKKHDAIIALGAVIRGGTPHFDYVAGECSRGIAQVALKHQLPVIFGVLTTDDVDQALERAGSGAGNKGFDTAIAALQMISLLDRIDAE